MARGGGEPVSSNSQELRKAEIRLKWDPSPWDEPSHHLDIIATTYSADAPQGPPVYVVHFDSRSPDGTINMNRHSQTGQGLGYVEEMTLELDRLASSFARVVVGVVIHQNTGPKTFGDLTNAGVLVLDGYQELLKYDLAGVAGSTAATVAEFTRDTATTWTYRELIRGFDSDPVAFTAEMGGVS
ncbi:TerD family protein [Streptomyces phaeoluteigriseus]|uniref:TerD family protein n=1 Tax=Streptomyces phaeoluteigriseus TaxID=114686 RepID=UPI0036969272